MGNVKIGFFTVFRPKYKAGHRDRNGPYINALLNIKFCFPETSRKWAELKFIFQNIGLQINFREVKVLGIIRRSQIHFSYSSMFQKGRG